MDRSRDKSMTRRNTRRSLMSPSEASSVSEKMEYFFQRDSGQWQPTNQSEWSPRARKPRSKHCAVWPAKIVLLRLHRRTENPCNYRVPRRRSRAPRRLVGIRRTWRAHSSERSSTQKSRRPYTSQISGKLTPPEKRIESHDYPVTIFGCYGDSSPFSKPEVQLARVP